MQPSTQPTYWLPRLLKWWTLATFVTFAGMLTHQSDTPILFGRYSLLNVLMLAGLFLLALLTGGAAIWLQRDPQRQMQIDHVLARWTKRRWFAVVVLSIASITLLLVWFFFLGNHLLAYSLLRAFIGMSVLVIALALLRSSDLPFVALKLRYLVWSGIALLVVIALLTISFYPILLKTDEAFVFSMARNTLETGQFRPMIYEQAFPEYYYGGIWTQMMAIWLKLAGVSLTSARLYNLVLASLTLAAIWGTTARLYDQRTAGYAVLIGAYAFISLNHIRFDIHTAFWLSLGLLFFSLSRPERWWAYLLAGFTIGLGVDSNPIAYCFSLGLLSFYAWEYIGVIRREKRWLWLPFWLTSVGIGAAFGLYLVIHAGQSFAGGQTSGGMLNNYMSFVRDNVLSGGYIRQAGQYLRGFLTAQPVLFVLSLIGFAASLSQRSRSDLFLVLMYAVWVGVVVFAYYYFPFFYLVLALPIIIILAARGISFGVPLLLSVSAEGIARPATMLLLVWLFASLAFDLRSGHSQSLEDVVETGRHIAQIVPQDAVIVAAEAYYFGMLDHQNFVGGAIETFTSNYRDMAPEQVWSTIAPDSIVFSEGWPTEPDRTPALMAYMQEQNFSLLSCYETRSFGRVELWSKAIPADVSPENECIQVCNPQTGC